MLLRIFRSGHPSSDPGGLGTSPDGRFPMGIDGAGPVPARSREGRKLYESRSCVGFLGGFLDFSFGFGSFSGQTWPQDPFRRVTLEKWCRTHLKSAPKTNCNAIS